MVGGCGARLKYCAPFGNSPASTTALLLIRRHLRQRVEHLAGVERRANNRVENIGRDPLAAADGALDGTLAHAGLGRGVGGE